MPLSEKTPFADEILFAVLAATDAVFIPDRDPTARSRHVVIYERRRDFPHFGIPWASEKVLPGLDDAARKQAKLSRSESSLPDDERRHQLLSDS